MSLDVYLRVPGLKREVPKTSGIFVRENGRNVEISQEEWESRHPGREPTRFIGESDPEEVFHYNITHNLSKMASEAGIYLPLWHPEELGFAQARDLILPLQSGLRKLMEDPAKFQAMNPENGWGNYEGLVDFAKSYLEACKEYPEAIIEVSR